MRERRRLQNYQNNAENSPNFDHVTWLTLAMPVNQSLDIAIGNIRGNESGSLSR